MAAYLIEPIQKGFMEEDLAENYGDISFYPYSQMFGKMAFETAFDEKKEECVKYLCYCALVNARAYAPLRKELKRIKSWDLFEKIEMPLVFTLKDMEKAGILVEQKALKEYGDRLGERLTSLEQEIGRASCRERV